ncbi:Ku protein [Streptomyces sp. NPDC049970]|uniref:non-homologous end joining protein Ku n=1 Tax=Streptomyces sp. NPDC049970 TaxID=3155033 RepID=UPI00343BAC16
MPRPLWTGAISFGLVTIPIKVVSATEDHSISFHQYHREDMGRIRTRKVCEIDGEVLTQEQIGKGYEVAKDRTVPVTDEELDRMPLPTAKAIEIVSFVDADSIDPVRIGDSYYLAVDGQVAAKPYTLLRKALERSEKVAVAKFAWHNRERLGLLRVRDDAIVLHSMRWPDEIRSPESLAPRETELDEDEIERAVQLTDSMGLDDISGFRDRYREALEELIAAKSEGKPLPAAPGGEEEEPGKVMDLMAALNASVKAAKETRGEEATAGEARGGDATVHEMTPGRTRARKKAAPASKKTAAGAAARKTGAGKTASGKAATGKAATGKAATGKASAGKAAAGRTAAKKQPARKTAARKRTAS